MIATFTYLLYRSGRNRVLRQARRLRRPRYLVALVLGLAYLWLILIGQRPGGGTAHPARAGWVELAAAMALALAVLWAWLFAAARRVLAFTPAEVTFLFPAPVTRRQLVHFKLLRTQFVILLNTLLWTLLLSRERFGISVWLRALALWVILTTLSLHRLGASFVRTSLAEHGRAGARHRAVALVVVGMAAAGAGVGLAQAGPALMAGWEAGIGPFLSALAAAAEGPIPTVLLYPFRLLAAPLAAASPEDWAGAMVPALVLLAAHYVWVIRADTAFEEAAVEESLRRARRLAESGGAAPRAVLNPRVRAPYRLRATGGPAEAIFWKNLTAVARSGRPRVVLVVLAVAGALLAALSFRGEGQLAEIVAWFAMLWAGFLVVVGPQWIRTDLRGDLPKLDLLRAYPLRGRTIVAAEVAASTVVLTALQLGILGLAYLALVGNRRLEPALEIRTLALGGAAVVLPALNLLGLLIQNGAAILLPSWVHLGAGRPGGVEALGQNMLALMGHLLILGMVLVPPAGLALLGYRALEPALGAGAVAAAGAAGLGLIAAEAAVAIGWLGRAFERTDPGALAP